MRLIEKMTADAKARVDEILAGAKKQAAEIEGEASAEIQRLQRAARLGTEKRVELERARRSARIFQQIKAEEARLKRDLVETAFDGARKQLDELGEGEYGDLFTVLAEEGLSDIDRKVIVSVRDGDRSRAEEAVKKAGVTAEVDASLEGQGGGLVIRSDGGEIFIDNTLHGRLERSRIEGVTTAGRILFGGGAGGTAGDEGPAAAEKTAKAAPKKSTAKKTKKKKE